MKHQDGFTLIEMMIVVAIIGALSAIALPAYQTYTKKTHVLEGINLSSVAKSSVWDYWSAYGTYPADNETAGLSSTISGHAVKNISISSGTIQISYNSLVTENATLLFTPSSSEGSIQWNCTGGTVLNKYRPVLCRN